MVMQDFTGFWKPWQKELAEKHGLTCPPGWYGFACGAGWRDILDRAFTALRAVGWNGEIHQIKEKFGTLRMYVAGDGKDALNDIIHTAEQESASTCEECGKEGRLRSGGWWHTYCDTCQEEYLGRRPKSNLSLKETP